MEYKFEVGDRVRVVKIDDEGYYGKATYKVGDVGTITCVEHGCRVRFDRLTHDCNSYATWWAMKSWLEPEIKQIMICE